MYRVRHLAVLALLFALLSSAFAAPSNKLDKKQTDDKKLASEIEKILSDPEAARKGSRAVYWPEKQDFSDTKIYAFDKLRPGNVIQGPAVVEGEYTTLVVPFPLRFSIDEHGLGILE